jgi:trimeric autotransporter adhesin
MVVCAGASVPVPRFRRVRAGSLARAGVLVSLVGVLAASGGGLAGQATPTAQPSDWSQLPLAARGPVAAAVASHDPRYGVTRSANGLTARNPAQRLRLRFSAAGVAVGAGTRELQLGLQTLGRGAAARRLPRVMPIVSAPNRTVYRRAGLSEWYANSSLGLEQGFTLRRRPSGHGELTFTIGLAGSLAAAATQHGQTVSFGSLAYRGLVVTDARGRRLPAHVQLERGRILIVVDDQTARYPVRVDPFVQSAELIASDRASGDNLGAGVAVSGNTIVAGTPFHTVNGNLYQGAVYVFTEPSGGWSTATQTAELTAADGAANDNLGWSVAVSGDTIVAGAINYNGGQPGQGAVYVFTEPGGGWTNATQTAELTASDGAANDNLGWSVGINGPTITAGAPSRAVNATHGAVYVYTKPAGGWINATQSAELTASDGAAADQLGTSVAISADTIVVGSPQHTVGVNPDQGSVYVYTEPGGGWTDATQTAELLVSDGAAYDALGWSVAIDGDTIAAGAPLRGVGANSAQGTVYVFTKPGGGWTDATETAALTASAGAASDQLGSNVGISNDTITAGAPQRTVGGHDGQGAVYVFTKPGGGWTNATQSAVLTASDGASNDELGSSVAVSGTTIAAGSPRRSLNRGVLYVFSSGLSIATTQQPASATVGSSIADQATVSGGDSPTGTVTFRLYDNPTATGPALFTSTKSLVSGTATSAGYATTGPGTYYWVATYNGDANNPSLSSGAADEPVAVKAQPSVSTTQQPASATVGSSIADKATVTGGSNPTGTVLFRLYDNATATGSPLFTDTEPLSSGNATSAGYATAATGTYYWVATYNGDATNFSATSGNASEPVSVIQATPSVSTTQQPATAVIGSSIADQATVSSGYNPTGTVTFALYDNSTATGSPLFSDTQPLSNGSATSAGFATAATGTYYWVATYNGDANNDVVSSGTADEPVTVTMATPSVSTTQQPSTAAVGSSIADKATVSAGYNPTGTITFELYDNSTAAGSPLYTDTEPLSSGNATSAGYAPTATGTYYWVATYSGDSDNNTAASGTADEPVTVTVATPSVSTTQQPNTATVGSSIADQATVTGGYNPTGTVTFRLYDNSTAAGSPLYTDTEPLSSGGATSASYSTAHAGTVYWVATYDGDANNGVSASGSADEPVTVTKATPSLATKRLQTSVKVGKPISDRATVSGGFHPSGKVTFRLYKNRSAKGKPVFTSTKSLSRGKATSARYKPKAPGKYYWVVTYNGDANNRPVSSRKASQPVSVHR